MKVLHIIPNLGAGGAEKLLVDLVKYMSMENIECEVIILSTENHFHLNSFNEMNIKVYIAPNKNVYSMNNIVFIYKILKTHSYDIVHTHLFAAQLFTPLAKFFARNSAVFLTTEHSTHNKRRDVKPFRILDYFMYKSYDGIISITKETNDNLNSYLISTKNKSNIVENGIDLNNYYEAKPLPLDLIDKRLKSSDKIILMVAGMREQKDQETFIRASKYLPDKYKLVLVGSGEREAEVHEYAKDYDNIFFLGERYDIAELMKSSYCFVLSSHWEGFGLVVIEAAASGLPVIASNVDGLNSVVQSIGGNLFEPKNSKDLANKILELESKEINIDRTNLAKYSVKKTVEGYLNYYRYLLSK